MNTGYHDRSKKARIYGSIIIYKIISLVILIALTIIMTFTFFIEKNKVTDANNRPVSVIFYIMGFCIFLKIDDLQKIILIIPATIVGSSVIYIIKI